MSKRTTRSTLKLTNIDIEDEPPNQNGKSSKVPVSKKPAKPTQTKKPSASTFHKSMPDVSSKLTKNKSDQEQKKGSAANLTKSVWNIAGTTTTKPATMRTTTAKTSMPPAPPLPKRPIRAAKSVGNLSKHREYISFPTNELGDLAAAAKKKKEAELLDNAPKDSPYLPHEKRNTAPTTTTTTNGKNRKKNERTAKNYDDYQDLPWLWKLGESSSTSKKFPMPLYAARNSNLGAYNRECVLRTLFHAFQEESFRQHLRRARVFQQSPDPNYISWTVNLEEGQSDGQVRIHIPETIRQSREAFSRIQAQTEQDIRLIFEYAWRLRAFLKNICYRAISTLIRNYCVSSSEMELSLFDDMEKVVSHYSTPEHRLTLSNISEVFRNICPAIRDQLSKGYPGPNFTDRDGNSEEQGQNALTDRVTFQMLESVGDSQYLTDVQNGFWYLFEGMNYTDQVMSAGGRSITVSDVLGFQRERFFTLNAIDALLNIIGNNSDHKFPGKNFYYFLISEMRPLLGSLASYHESKIPHLRKISERREYQKKFLDNPSKGHSTKDAGTFRIIFPVLIQVRLTVMGQEQLVDRFVLVIASFTQRGRTIELYGSMARNWGVVGTADTPYCRTVRESLNRIHMFLEEATSIKWTMGNNWPSTQVYSSPANWFRQTNLYDSGVFLVLRFERLFQGTSHFDNTHDLGALHDGVMDRQRFDYLNYLIDRYQGSLHPRDRIFWEPVDAETMADRVELPEQRGYVPEDDD